MTLKSDGEGGLASPFPRFPPAPEAPAEEDLVMEKYPSGASEPLPRRLHGGGTKSFGFEGPALVMVSATSIVLKQTYQSLQPREREKYEQEHFPLVFFKPETILLI